MDCLLSVKRIESKEVQLLFHFVVPSNKIFVTKHFSYVEDVWKRGFVQFFFKSFLLLSHVTVLFRGVQKKAITV